MRIKTTLKSLSFWHKLALLCAFIFLWAVCFVREDPDMGWHLRSGYDIINGGIPKTDLYTYTMPLFRWINHEWFNDVLMYVFHFLGGRILLSLVFAAAWFSSILLATRKKTWQIIFLACIGLSPYLGIRPVVWTFLGIIVLERLVERYHTVKKKQLLVGIIFLFMVWANLHGGFAVGLGILTIYSLLQKSKPLFLTVLISTLGTLFNPYGWRVYEEILRTTFDSQLKHTINEWHSLYSSGLSLRFTVLIPTIFIVVSLIFLFYKKLKIVNHLQTYSVALLTLFAALFSTRHMVLFVATVSRYNERQFRNILLALPQSITLFFQILFSSFVVMIFVYCGWMISLKPALGKNDGVNIGSAVAQQCNGNIFNSYDIGGHLIYTAKNVKVYIDGRMPSWSNEEGRIFDRYIRMLNNSNYREREFQRYNIQCVVIKNTNEAIITWLDANNWQEMVSSDIYTLYSSPK